MYYLVEEVTSGLVEGYYTNIHDANSYQIRHQNMMQDCIFVVTAHTKQEKIVNEQMLKHADWFKKRRGAK